MGQYHNLYSSIKFREPDSEIQEVNTLKSDGQLKTSWQNLFEKYPNRFFVGTDLKFGHGATDYQKIAEINELLSVLSDSTYQKIVNSNASKLLN